MIKLSAENWGNLREARVQVEQSLPALDNSIADLSDTIRTYDTLRTIALRTSKLKSVGTLLNHDVSDSMTVIYQGLEWIHYARNYARNKENPPPESSLVKELQSTIRKRLWTVFQAIDSLQFWAEGETLSTARTTAKEFFTNTARSELVRTFVEEETDRSIFFTITEDAGDVPIDIHNGTIGNLLLNMCRNSRRPGLANQMHIQISRKDLSIIIEVTDNGIGVEPNIVERMFEEGFSGRGSTGLGLAQAKERMATMNGTIECEGHGGIFNSQGKRGAKIIITTLIAGVEQV